MADIPKVITDPTAALKLVGTENTELHEELRTVYGELDVYRNALTAITKFPGPAALIALKALGGK